jgi:hypothetical protein
MYRYLLMKAIFVAVECVPVTVPYQQFRSGFRNASFKLRLRFRIRGAVSVIFCSVLTFHTVHLINLSFLFNISLFGILNFYQILNVGSNF